MEHWMKRKSPQKKGRTEERNSAKRIGGRCVPNSGAPTGMGGDILGPQNEFLIEHKYTEGKSFRLTRDMLKKIEREAMQSNRNPALWLNFENGEQYIIVRLCDVGWEE